MKLLIVEDEHRIGESLKRGFEQEHFVVDLVFTGTDGYEMATSENYDLIILDLMLPGMTGIEICEKLRFENIHTPILMLTAKSELDDKVKGLNTGADDYLTKPFAFEELLARVRALLRRPTQESSNILTANNISMDTSKLLVTVDKKEVVLSSREYALLEYLLRHKGVVVTKDQIIERVWDYEADVLPNTVEVYIRKLRNKIGIESIKTIRGFGYRLG